MGFFTSLFNLLESLFSGLSPESKLKQDLRKIEADLKMLQPPIYKNGVLLGAFPESFRLLQIYTKPIEAILSASLCSTDINTRNHYASILIETGLSDKAKEAREQLDFEVRKSDFFSSPNNQRIIDSQRHNLDSVLRDISGPKYAQIEKTMQTLDQLHDLCTFAFTPLITQFAPNYMPGSLETERQYNEVPIEAVEKKLLDFHYIAGNLTLTASTGRALCALEACLRGTELSSKEQEELLSNLKKTASILKNILTPQLITQLMRLIRNDINFVPKTSMEHRRYISEYVERLRKQFDHDTERIQLEIQNDHIASETKTLFANSPLLELEGYSEANNAIFQQSGAGSFLWILPLKIIKSFQAYYMNDKVKSLLNDLVVEGFFNNPQYKSEFSSIIFNAVESSANIEAFEHSFTKGEPNDMLLMTGYLRDSRTNPEFLKNLTKMINDINKEAKKLIQSEVSAIYHMWQKLEELLPDSKKPQPEIISNLKVLFISPRNREKAEFLEQNIGQWSVFLDVMKNYAIIGAVRDE